MRLFRFDDPAHAEASALLPWYANGTLNARERSSVERHVAECVACRRDLAELSQLQEALQEHDDFEVPASLDRMHALLDIRSRPRPQGVGGLMDKWDRLPIWARVTLSMQSGLMVLLLAGMVIGRPASVQYYRALGAGPALASGVDRVVVVFAPGTSEQTMRQTILRVRARVVDGPNAAGAYTLQLPAGAQKSALAAFRARADVVFAEPTPISAVNNR
jgi:anti-sigma factor RsiW